MLVHARKETKSHRTQAARKLHGISCPDLWALTLFLISCPSIRKTLSSFLKSLPKKEEDQDFIIAKESPPGPTAPSSLCPATSLAPLVRTFSSLNQHKANLRRKTKNDYVFPDNLAFPARTKLKAARKAPSPLQRKQANGQGLCQTSSLLLFTTWMYPARLPKLTPARANPEGDTQLLHPGALEKVTFTNILN